MLLECGRRASTVVLRLNVRIFLKRRGLKLEIKGRLVYIPTYSPTQHISFDTTDQFCERWSGEELVKFKHFSDVYSNWLDLSIGSITPRQSRSRRLCLFPPRTSVTSSCWKTGRRSCLLGTQDVIQAAQYLAIRNWQPLNCHSSRTTGSAEANQDMSGQTSWRVSRGFGGHATWEPQTNSVLRRFLTIQRFAHTRAHLLYTHTHTHTSSAVYTHALPTRQWLQKEQGDKTKWIADTSSLPCPLKLNYTCWGDERHITEPSD